MDKQPESINYSNIDFSETNILEKNPYRHRRSSIIVTLADMQITEVDIQKMLESGMNVAKLKLASSSLEDKTLFLNKIKKAAQSCCTKFGVIDWPIATCIELKTCIVKTGLLDNDQNYVTMLKNSNVILTFNINYFNKCSGDIIYVDNRYLVVDVVSGVEISIAADEIILKCIETVDDKSILCVVVKGGLLTNLNNVCTRNANHSRPLLTDKDIEIIKFALEHQMETIIINYVRHPDALRKIKNVVKLHNAKRPFLMCGICTEQGLAHIDEIIQETDGLILSREYLPFEMDASKKSRMPQIQKSIAGKCLKAGKPFYLSGGVLETALKCGKIIHSEISDFTNALLDHTTGFVLKECYDTDIINMVLNEINALCHTIEPLEVSKTDFRQFIDMGEVPVNAAKAAIVSCVAMANQTNARVIVIPTVSGRTIKYLQWMRPFSIVIAVTADVKVMRLLYIYKSIFPLMHYADTDGDWNDNISSRVLFAIEYAVKRNWLEYGDTYITLQRGSESSAFCDTVRICKVSFTKKHMVECPDDDELNSKFVL